MNGVRMWLIMLAFLTGSCSFATRENASTLPFRLYGDGQINRAYMAWNGSTSGEVWFSSKDGESFTGEYTTIAPEVYHQDLSMFITRIGRTSIVSSRPSFGSTTSNVQYGLASAGGDRGTTVVCKYIATVSLWAWGFSATGTCLDSKGKNYSLHASSRDSESLSLNEAQLKVPANPGADESSEPVASSTNSEQFAASFGKPVDKRPAVQREEEEPVKAQLARAPKHKFYGRLVIYAGRIVPLGGASAGNVRVEFEEESPGHGSVRLIEPGNNVFDGNFTAKNAGEPGIFRMITQKTAQQLDLSRTEGWGMLSASDEYGSFLECVYGTLALSKRQAGLCEDTRGNKYRLYFD
jgi:hypothetical protein